MSDDRGYTIVESLVATILLVVGVMAGMTLIDQGNRSTSRTLAREQGTNLARQAIEQARAVPYALLTVGGTAAQLAPLMPGSPAASGPTFSVHARGVDYAVTATSCTIDDPSDGAGIITTNLTQWCDAPATGDGTGGTTTGATGPPGAASVNAKLLGMPLSLDLSGDVFDQVCGLVGRGGELSTAVGALSFPVARANVRLCTSSSGSTSLVGDPNPDDLRRVEVIVRWRASGGGVVRQATLLPNPAAT